MMFLLVMLLCSGCAIGVKHNYADVMPQLTVAGPGTLAVATHDQRPYILSGDTGPEFVGLSRGGYGNPFQVQTASGYALADDMAQVMCTVLREKGFDCVPMLAAASDTPEEVHRKLQGAASPLALLLVLREWKSDTSLRTSSMRSRWAFWMGVAPSWRPRRVRAWRTWAEASMRLAMPAPLFRWPSKKGWKPC